MPWTTIVDAPDVGESAYFYAKSGIPVFPCNADKSPATPRGFKDATNRLDQVKQWWRDLPNAKIGVPTGRSFVVIDCDAKHHHGLVEEFEEACRVHGVDWLIELPKQSTPNGGGCHFLFKCDQEIRNKVLARNAQKDTIIETRGSGGYVCVSPSEGYFFERGGISSIPTITEAQLDAIFSVARSFSCIPEKEHREPVSRAVGNYGDGVSPGDDYNERGEVLELLRSAGWTAKSENHWIRPGKKDGLSATWDKVPGKFYVFTSNADPFEPNSSYSPFAVYAYLRHQGDFQRAANALISEGYGKQATVLINDKPEKPKKDSVEEAKFIELCASRDQAGASELIIRLADGRILFDHTAKIWRIYQNGVWVRDELRGVRRYVRHELQQSFRRMAKIRRAQMDAMLEKGIKEKDVDESESGRAWKACIGQVANLNKRHYLDNVLELAGDGSAMGVLATDFDQDPFLFACSNGVIDLKMFSFRESRPEDRISKRSLIEYRPEATCPKWDEFISTIFCGDEELGAFMQRFWGYCLTGEVGLDAVSIAYGGGGNGKTVGYNILTEVFGDYASHLPIETLLQQGNKRDSSSDYEKMRLLGARFVVASEIPEHRRINESLLKDISGGDSITARSPYEKPVTFKPTHKLHLMGNHKPQVKGTDDGIWRRLYLVPFNHKFAQPGNDGYRSKEDVMEDLRAELPGILNWLVDGLRALRTNGLNPPASVKGATDEFRRESDQIAEFIENACEEIGNLSEAVSDMYRAYKEFCDEEEERPMSKKGFSQSLERRGYQRWRSGSERRILGLKLRK